MVIPGDDSWPSRLLRLVCLLMISCAPVSGAADTGYLRELQARADASGLAETREWRALLHYEERWLGTGVTSTVATPWFFQAESGRSDPAAELAATLAAFFRSGNLQPRDEPAQCMLRARYRFLDRHLHFDPERLPPADCPAFEQWLAGLDPEAVSLVFPAAYLNGPSSMFGHTLLRIDAHGQQRSTQLLAYAINFAANTEEDNGAIFAVKGLAGGYAGVYGIFPYYEKVKQYAWIENRDVWDYRLQLSDPEIQRLLAHLWEMKGVSFDYYFLIKNCSYQLLSLLEAARPALRVTERFNWYAIPADTIRALREIPGLLGEPHYRPSLQTNLSLHAGALTPAQRGLALSVARGERPPDDPALQSIPSEARARTLQVAHDYLYYEYQTGEADRDGALPRARAILVARSRVPAEAHFPTAPKPQTPPDAGHNPRRTSVSGVSEDGEFSLGIRIRPAYHDLLDPPGGYTDGAQLKFLELGLRVGFDKPQLKLEDLTAIDILSLSPRSALFKPISWQVSTGLRRRPLGTVFGDAPGDLGYYLEGGPGLAWGDTDRVAGYAFALASADANGGFDNDYALGAGASVGLLARPLPSWRVRGELGGLDYALGDDSQRYWARLTQQWPLPVGLGLRLRLGWEQAAGNSATSATLGVQAYF